MHTALVESPEDLLSLLRGEFSDIEGLWASGLFFTLRGGFNQFIDHLPTSLKVISFAWVGSNMFDVARINARGIILTNVGDASSKDVADIALTLTLATFRYTSYFESSLRVNDGDITKARLALGSAEVDENHTPIPLAGPANWTKSLTVGGKSLDSPNGKTAGIVGLGAIGKEIAKRLDAIGLKIKYTKRTPLTDEESSSLSFDVEFVESFNELIASVDVLVLAVPHTAETIDLINSESIKLVKKGIRIVNIGRGSAIDEDVLFRALDDGTVNSVGLDVFQHEPLIDKRYLNRPDVSLLPHLGAFTLDTFQASALSVIANLRDVLLHNNGGISPVK